MATYVQMEKAKDEEGIEGDEGGKEGDDVGVSIRPSRMPSPLKLTIIVLAVLLTLTSALCITLGVLYGVSAGSSSSSSSSSSSDTCQSDACFDLSVRIQGTMNEDTDPCEDFYNFTCGNWDIYNHITPGDAGYGALILQSFAVLEELADFIEANDFVQGNKVLLELQDFYDSCITSHLSDDFDIEPLRVLYRKLGGWSLVNISGDGSVWGLNSTQFIKEKMLQSPAFYSIDIDVDDLMTFILEIDQSGLTVDVPFFYNDSNSTGVIYDGIVLALTMLLDGNTTEEIFSAAQDIVAFETELAKIWDTDYGDNSINTTVAELNTLWPDYDWQTALTTIFKAAGVDLMPTDKVTVISPTYFRKLGALISSTPVTTLENYAKWQLAWKFSEEFGADDEFQEHLVLFREKVMGKPTMEQRSSCVEQVQSIMPLALARLYAEQILPSGSKEVVTKLVSEVRGGLRERMMDVDWLDDETRKLTIEKLNAIEARVAYPDKIFNDDYLQALYGEYNFGEDTYIENYIQYLNASQLQILSLLHTKLDKDMWYVPPTAVNAYYSPTSNQITILEGIMHIPVFDSNWPLPIQYGGLGVVLGHELTHGFDNEGRRYDKEGRRRQWWTDKSIENYKAREDCFVEQYSGYEMFGISVDGNLTLGENIADNGGLKASYGAYKSVSKSSKKLPGLRYTSDQLFFIQFGQLWCSYNTPTSFRYDTFDEHSPAVFRVIGSLVNNKEFAEAFSCPESSPMNPAAKCLLW